MDEHTLLDLYKDRDPRAIEELLVAYGYTARRIAMNILAGEREAEACIRAAAEQTLEALSLESSLPSGADLHLQRITRKIALERYAASQAAKRGYNLFSTITDELGECFPPTADTPTAPSEPVGDHLNRFLNKKNRETRDIFICRYFYAESLTEIARRFGIQEPRIKSRLRKTNRQLAAFWAQEATDTPLSYPALLQGLNLLDDAVILSAHRSSKQLRRLIPWGAAACAAVLLAVSFPYLREVINTDLVLRDPDWDKESDRVGDAEIAHKPDEESILGIGSFASLGANTIRLTEVTDTTITLTLIKNDDTPLYAAVYDRLGDALACTDPSYKVDGAVIRHGRIKVYTEGSDTPATELPVSRGRYTLVVDFASIRNGSYPMADYVGFFAYIGKNGAPVTVYFSLAVPEETTETENTETETTEAVSDD